MTTQAGLAPDLYFAMSLAGYDEQPDGTVVVHGIPCNPETLDVDGQIADKDWLKTALSRWHQTGSNVREMHQPSAVGVGKTLEWDGDVPHLTAHIVDPVAAKKVRAGVYKAFSIGVKRPVLVKDRQAPNGRIKGGDIVESSLVDRPAIPGSDILDFKGDLFKIASAVSEDEVLDHQNGVVWRRVEPLLEKRDFDPGVGGGTDRDKIPAEDFGDPANRKYPIVTPKDVADAAGLIGHADNPEKVKNRIIEIARRKGQAFVDRLPDSWTDQKETKVADNDTTEKTEVADVEKAATETEKTGVLAELEKRAARSTFCPDCGKTAEILDGAEKTIAGQRLLIGKDASGHELKKFVGPAEAEKTTEAETGKDAEPDAVKAADEEKTVEASEAKAADAEAGAEKATEPDAGKNMGDGDADEGECPLPDKEKSVETGAPAAAEKAAVAGLTDTEAALASLILKTTGIDLAKVAAEIKMTKAERLAAKTAELQALLAETGKSAESGGTTTLTGISAETAGRIRMCISEINELAAQMGAGDGKFDTNDQTQEGSVDMGAAHVAPPTDRIDQQKAAEAELVKNAPNAGAVDAAELAKAIAAETGKTTAAELAKVVGPLVERLAEVEHQVKPASPPWPVQVGERGSAFVGKEATAAQIGRDEANQLLQKLSDDDRTKLVGALLSGDNGWTLNRA